MKKNVMIVGVGGQGTILASKLLGNVALAAGYDVKVSEVHGMSQRGGSVVTYVRYGDGIESPIITEGEADYILSFEQVEAVRYLANLKTYGTIVVSTATVAPAGVLTGSAIYPYGILERLEEKNKDIKIVKVDADGIAKSLNFIRSANMALLGAFAAASDFDKQLWLDAIAEQIKPQFLEVNVKAFEEGYQTAKKQ